MPIQTDLNVNPYYDDFDPNKNYYKILFKPGIGVQVREINQLQTLLQNQIEHFGDNIYQKGTIIAGCNFIFHNPLKYVKIKDNEPDGTPIVITDYKGKLIKSVNNGLTAEVVEAQEGYETASPDLKTLFVKYLNTGTSGETEFTPDENILAYTSGDLVEDIDIFNGSAGFSNDDIVVLTSAITVSDRNRGQNFGNTFSVGETLITQSGATVQIFEIDTDSSEYTTVLRVKPLASQLKLSNNTSWELLTNEQFYTDTSNITGYISGIIGGGATATLVTNQLGGITTCIPTSGGNGYSIAPHVSVSFAIPDINANEGLIDALNIEAKTYKATAIVNDSLDSTGNGYGFSIGPGVIYQNGYFIRTAGDFIVVDKYTDQTDKVVGFSTSEKIRNYLDDDSLYDNATGTTNENAPGADRLELIPTLEAITKDQALANAEFFPIVEFSEGRPFKQNDVTVFNVVGEELARRTKEESGDYVLDEFLVRTNSTETIEKDATKFEVSVDPGKAYIEGHRVETVDNYSVEIDKGTDTKQISSNIQLDYGNYFVVNELAGSFNFGVGDIIEIHGGSAPSYLSSFDAASTITSPGSQTHKARIRSLQLTRGEAGTPGAEYRLYVYDVTPTSSTSAPLRDATSIYYNGTPAGIANIVQEAGITRLYGTNANELLFDSGGAALKSIEDLTYTYRTEKNNGTVILSTNGNINVNLTAQGETFNYAGTTLTEQEKLTLIASPQSTVTCANVTSGVSSISLNGNTVNGTATTFSTDFVAGDYVKVATAGGAWANIGRIVEIRSDTEMQLATDIEGAATITSANVALCFPANIPIPLYLRSNRTVTLGSANTTLNISVGNTSISADTDTTIAYEAQTTAPVVTKEITRKSYVKLHPNTDLDGPWNLGASDIVRLRGVYQGAVTDVDIQSVSGAGPEYTITLAAAVPSDTVVGDTISDEAATPKIYSITNIAGSDLTVTDLFNNGVSPDSSGTSQSQIQSVSTSDSNIKNSFYIDHKQLKNSYGIGKLYKVDSFTLTASDFLLVEFDVLIHSGPGVKTISSYPIDDTLKLSDNTNAIHTLEIPEFFSNQNRYFDLRDYIDFRPRSQNTTTITTVASEANIDPTLNTYEDLYDLTVEKKFPSPSSSCSFTMTKYLSRIDTIYVNSAGDFNVVRGYSSDNPVAKPRKQTGLFLNNIIIDAYPSIPRSRLPEITQYINGRSISSGQRPLVRIGNFKARVGDETKRLDEVQPKGYTMSEIGGLERRIADLEYYTALSFTENEVNNLQIPGSTGINRFKFGFFVDNFTTDNYFDWRDNKSRSQIHAFRLKPKKKQRKIRYKFNENDTTTSNLLTEGQIKFNSNPEAIVEQPIACESDTVLVRTTQTIKRTDIDSIQSITTEVKEITRTEYEQSQKTIKVAVPYIKNTGNRNLPRREYNDSGYSNLKVIHTFTVGKLAGTIYAFSQTQGQHIALQRNVNGVWTYVCSTQHNRRFITFTNNGLYAKFNYPYTPTISGGTVINRQFRWVVTPKGQGWSGDRGKALNFVNGYYPTTSDAVRYDTQTKTITDENQVTDTVTEVLESSEIESSSTQTIVSELFNSNRTSLVQIDNLFDTEASLNTPYIDLVKYIREDLDDNPDPTVYTDSTTSEDLP
jgi:hypothetical protein